MAKVDELADLVDSLYDGSSTVKESGAMLTRCHEILGHFAQLERDANRWQQVKRSVSYSEPAGKGTLWHVYTDRRLSITRNPAKDFEETIDADLEAT